MALVDDESGVTGPEGGTEPLRARDADGFFLDTYGPMCRVAFLMVGDHGLAEEIVMDAFAAATTRWDRISVMTHPEAYVRRMVINLTCSRLRRRFAERRAVARFAGRAERRPAWEPDDGLTSGLVLAAIAKLPDRQRAAIVLRYLEDLPEAEVAASMGCSVGTVKSQLSKARSKLQKHLEAAGLEGIDRA